MGVQTAAGTTVSICAEHPNTFDQSGYQGTGMNWAVIGEIVDAGTHGRKYAEVTFKPIGSRGTQKFKGSFDEGQKTLVMGLDRSDAGQVIANAALVSDNDYSFRVLYPDHSADYFQAKVMSFEKKAATVDTVVEATMMLSLTTNAAGVGIIEVAAP